MTITVRVLEDVQVQCRVVEDLGFSHDAGHFVKVVLYEGKERVVVKKSGHIWRFWTAEDRAGHGHRAGRITGQ